MLGCDSGPAVYPASGVVRFENGQPVRNASIEFVPKAGGPSPRARIDAEGRFVLGTYASDDGAPPGAYLVIVIQPLPPSASGAARSLGEEHADHAGSAQAVSLRHASTETTGIEARVEATDSNEFELVVQPL